ncbi:hypothetical protein ZOSMA_122G00150 [Zostera marina]|uniref:Disease resistance R13L4/SHOC-2-like LRR domain-containing protein n=1 Tax=Zostera marina TaxID=29655 RepID=A0A0K9Q2S6_ZOSMR|nr:hypothetical protein ZOSMA_122G00150 [Zostera marina]
MLYKMKYLRSLDLSCTDVEELPYDLGINLVHLHFLGLNSTPIKILPDSICKLYSLHTLELRKCKNLQELPKDIGSMISLTHLDISMDLTTFCMPSGIGKLSELKTLGRFNVGRHVEYAGIKELEELNNLTGEVCISGLYLCLDSMFLKKIGLEFFHAGNHRGKCFPELRELEFRNLHELEEIQEWSEFCKDTFPVLCKVTFFNCPLLKKIPRFKYAKLRKLEIERCGAL